MKDLGIEISGFFGFFRIFVRIFFLVFILLGWDVFFFVGLLIIGLYYSFFLLVVKGRSLVRGRFLVISY